MVFTQARSGHAETSRDSDYLRRLKPLRWLLDELNANHTVVARLVTEGTVPYVALLLPGTAGFQVQLAMCAGRCVYVWGEPPTNHYAGDPAGAARRLVVALRRQQRDEVA